MASAHPTTDPSARPKSAAGTTASEIARLRAHIEDLEQQLKAFEAHHTSFDHSHIDDFAATMKGWFWETDERHRFTYLSPSVHDTVGVSPEWHYGKTRSDFGVPGSVSPEDWDAHLAQLDRREPFSDFVYQRKGPDGLRWLSVSGRPYHDGNGRFLGYRGSATDITGEMTSKTSMGLLLAAIENLREPMVLWDAEERLILGNRPFRAVTAEIADSAVAGTSAADFFRACVDAGFFPDADADPEGWLARRLERFRDPELPFEIRRPDGRWILLTEHRLPDGSTLSMSTDITGLKHAEMELAQKTAILETALETIPDGIQVIDRDTGFLAWNDQLFDIMELDKQRILEAPRPGRAFFEHLARRGDYGPGKVDDLVESRLQPVRELTPVSFERQLQSGKWIECRGGPISGGGYVAVYRDIDENKRLTERLTDQASVDELTRLSNRRHFLEVAGLELDRSRRYRRDFAMVMVDIDHFKQVNDLYGHAGGDEVLRAVSAVCGETARDCDRVGRLGGEEFAIMLPETNAERARSFAERLRQAICRQGVTFDGRTIHVTASFGIAELAPHHRTLAQLMEDADKALYAAKRGGRNRTMTARDTA